MSDWVGYEGKTLDPFVCGLRASGTRLLVDVRLNPVSRKSGFSKRALAAALADAGIGYCNAPQLGNPAWNRPGFTGTAEEVQSGTGKVRRDARLRGGEHGSTPDRRGGSERGCRSDVRGS